MIACIVGAPGIAGAAQHAADKGTRDIAEGALIAVIALGLLICAFLTAGISILTAHGTARLSGLTLAESAVALAGFLFSAA